MKVPYANRRRLGWIVSWLHSSVETSMKQFTDQSTATRMEKAKRVLRSLANGHDYRYFHGDGYPRHNDLQQDAAAALEVLEQLTKPAN